MSLSQDQLHHEQFMALAIREAEKGLYTARPNPRVGCVLVRDNQVIGKGFHLQTGTAHAEVNAIASSEVDVAGSTAYVTLEPCSFVGRTPSCADLLIEKGIARVVFASEDPHPGNRGKGLDKLRAAGIEVIGPVLEASAIQLNRGHFKKHQQQLPYVTLKLAQSLDGKTALANGLSQWITGPEARRDVQRLRARNCAVITGVDSVLADDPGMNVRADELGFEPGFERGMEKERERAQLASEIRRPIVVLDSVGRMPKDAKLVGNSNLIVATTQIRDDFPVQQAKIGADDKGHIDLSQLLQFLVTDQDCSEVLFECGATLAGSVIQSGLLDELVLYVAPKLLGSSAKGLVQLDNLVEMANAPEFELVDSRTVGSDIRLTLRPKHELTNTKFRI
jgi:diaminohydroxyphosphoribosylaminopyrimidine deaminase/5-amino-6-(5-phosphoribosylamino)uracil reductase